MLTYSVAMDDFVPRRGWGNPHLQTVRSRIRPRRVRLPASDEVIVTLPDGSGDRLAVQVHEADPVAAAGDHRARSGRHRGIRLRPVHGRRPAHGGLPGGQGRSSRRRDVRGGLGGQLSRRSDRGSARCHRHPRSAQCRRRLLTGRQRHHQTAGRTQPGGGRGRGRLRPAGSCGWRRAPAPHRRRVVREVPAAQAACGVLAPGCPIHPGGTRGHHDRPRPSSTSTMPSPRRATVGATPRSTTGSIPRSATWSRCSSRCSSSTRKTTP